MQYKLMLDQEWRMVGRCYWTIDARAHGRTWRRFYVSPDGRRLLDVEGKSLRRSNCMNRTSAIGQKQTLVTMVAMCTISYT